jgi:hypothetical protein
MVVCFQNAKVELRLGAEKIAPPPTPKSKWIQWILKGAGDHFSSEMILQFKTFKSQFYATY